MQNNEQSGADGPSLEGHNVLVTGANGGLGEQFVRQALERGAAKVYATARTPRDWSDARIHPLKLDITDPESVSQTAAVASDVTILINNAGIAPAADSLFGSEDEARLIIETNYFGPLRVAKAFTPVLAANGNATILNIVSLAAWLPLPTVYAASKAALGSATNGLRMKLEGQGIKVISLYVGVVDTPMTVQYDIPKASPASIVAQAYDGIEAGVFEVIADDLTRQVKSGLGTAAEKFLPPLHEMFRPLFS
ncbi:SDR family oxidoreductase [Sphingomonas sp. PAMC 26605]|uniref:SDR family oxidoreductase n=1 Tax=Sphingomonas sp. PAMC 26605 TaxID=1112214 RepID=UPI00026CD7E9|nr:SDR family oxidoreductase [Sphingomonas sp. PAMC 26605]